MTDWSRISDRWRPAAAAVALVAVAFVVAGLALAAYGDRLYRAQKTKEIEVQAQIVADSVTAALAFDDQSVAQEYVNALRANPEVEAAGVYDERGALAASYARSRADAPPQTVRLAGPTFQGSHVRVVAPVVQNGARLGAVYLQAATEPTIRRLARYGGAALLALMAALVIAVLAAAQATLRTVNRALRDRAHDLAEANQMLRVQIAERERAEEALRQSQKMEAIGQLTGGVAHDFNNLLMVVSSGLDLMERTTNPERRAMLRDSVRQALDRGASLTRQLLAFSRRSALKPEVVDLKAQIEGTQVLLERSLREDITVEMDLADDLWPVEIDPSQLELSLINIAVNARDAMPSGGLLRVTAENRPGLAEDGPARRLCARHRHGQRRGASTPSCWTGCSSRSSPPRRVGRGTGLGLSQVYGFTPRLGRGRCASAAASARARRSPCTCRARTRTWPPGRRRRRRPTRRAAAAGCAAVEDDESVAMLVGEMLTELGYEPSRAATAEEALRRLEAGGRFDLVFSDMVMPGAMNGIELAREIRRRLPALPVVLTTASARPSAAATAEGLRLVLKPYRIDRLAAELEAARSGRRTAAGGR
ncbi:MAG: CHASE sensor domain-containing protein [Caulobacteraceae bacterium]